MTTKYKTKAFVFRKNDRNESDRVFSVFSNEFGRLNIHAKAIRKSGSKLRSGIDTFFISDLEFIQGKNRKTLTDAVALEKFKAVCYDLEKFKIANKIGEVLDKFIKGEEKDKEIFGLLSESMQRLVNSKNNLLTYYYFLWNIISVLGYHVEVKKCADCSEKLTPYNIYFSAKEGGVICERCLPKDKFALKINSDIVKIIRIILTKDWQTLSKLKINTNLQNLFKEVSDNALHAFCPS